MLTCRPAQHWHFVGDSITAFGWYAAGGGFVSQVNASIASLPSTVSPGVNVGASFGIAASSAGTARNLPVNPTQLSVTSSGVVGNKIADIEADVPGRITNFNPDVIVIEVGVNDVIGGTAGTDFSTSYASVLDQIIAWNPTRQIGCVSILCYGEQWQAGGDHWGPNTLDAQIADFNGRILAAANTRGATYIDMRTPLGVWETQNNLPGPPGTATGNFTNSGDPVHPSGAGQTLMGTFGVPFVGVTQ